MRLTFNLLNKRNGVCGLNALFSLDVIYSQKMDK